MAKKIDYTQMYTLRSDGRYMGYWHDTKDKRHAVYDKDAEKLHSKILELENVEVPVIKFKDAAEEWERNHREKITVRTWNNYKPHYDDIISKFGSMPIEDVTALDVLQDLKRSKAAELSATIVNTRRCIYKMIFDQAIISGYINFNPVTAVPLPKGLKRGKREAPSDEIIKTIFKNINEPFGFFPFFLLCTGLRKSEALALTWADIDFENKIISISKSLEYINGANPQIKSPKTAAGVRDIPILSILEKPLKDRQKTSKSDYIFPSEESNRGGKGGGMMTARGYEGAWQRYCQLTGLIDDNSKPTITAHNLRHGTATLMFESGVDELTAQRILGHSRIEITREIYTQLREKQQRKSIAKLNIKLSKLLSSAK